MSIRVIFRFCWFTWEDKFNVPRGTINRIELKKDSFSVKDHFKTQEVFQLKWNEKWNCYETFPKPDLKEVGKYYESENYISHQKKSKSLKNRVYNWVRNYMLKTKIDWIKTEVNSGKKLLDVGCGVGAFVEKANEKGFDAVGIEPNEKARNLAKENHLEVYSKLDELKEKKFDVITLWHVLEHLHQPSKFLKEVNNSLTENGKLFIAVPNFKSYDAKHYKEFWAAFDVPRHLYHFSKESISILADQNHFEVIKTYPLKFDSYYVSMLSEKYKTGSSGLKWIWQGLISNYKAKKNGEWSSLVFVLQKE